MVKDEIVSWFIKNVLLPKAEIIDKPGFIVADSGNIKLRELLIPERFLSELEKEVARTYGDKGGQVLYSAGKKFGYAYASLANFPTMETSNKRTFEEFGRFLVRWVGATYSRDIKHTFDTESKRFELDMEGYIVCSTNGIGMIMTDGGVSGIWAYMASDKTLEGAQTTCQGRGFPRCHLIVCPPRILDAAGIKHYTEIDLVPQKCNREYQDMNSIKETTYCKLSLKDLINAGLMKYQGGIMEFREERHFLAEASLIYILEEEMRKLENGEEMLYNAAHAYGKRLGEKMGFESGNKVVTDYMSTTGWGDMLIKNNKVISVYHPWLEKASGSKHVIYRGLVAGLLTGVNGSETNLKKTIPYTITGYYNLITEE